MEAAYAFLKPQYGMKVNKVWGLGRVAVYALYSVLCHVLTREAAENIGRPDKALSRRSSTRDGGCFEGYLVYRLEKGIRGFTFFPCRMVG